MSEKLLPLADQVVVRRHDPQTKTAGGLIIPGGGEKSRRAEVIAVGGGRITETGYAIEPRVKAGDVVILNGYNTDDEIDLNGDKVLLVREANILAIVQTL